MEREWMQKEVAKIEAFIASFRFEEGEVAFAAGMKCFRAKPIRSVCIRRDIRAQGRRFKDAATKDAYIAAIWEDCTAYSSNDTTEVIPQDDSPQDTPLNSLVRPMEQTIHSSIRLLNVLFSSRFTARLAQIRVGSVADDTRFWEDVLVAYLSTEFKFDTIISPRECFRKLHSSTTGPHTPTELRDTWNILCGAYRAAYERSMMSEDNTTRDFGDVYTGRLDVLYLHEWLLLRPEHVAAVGLGLPTQGHDNDNNVEPQASPSAASVAEDSEGDIQNIEASSAADTQVNEAQTATNLQLVDPEPQENGTQNDVENQLNEERVADAQILKRKMELLENITEILHRDAPDETEIKRRKLKESSEYVQSLFRTVEAMRSAGCSSSVVTEMLDEAQRQASKLVRESKAQLP